MRRAFRLFLLLCGLAVSGRYAEAAAKLPVAEDAPTTSALKLSLAHVSSESIDALLAPSRAFIESWPESRRGFLYSTKMEGYRRALEVSKAILDERPNYEKRGKVAWMRYRTLAATGQMDEARMLLEESFSEKIFRAMTGEETVAAEIDAATSFHAICQDFLGHSVDMDGLEQVGKYEGDRVNLPSAYTRIKAFRLAFPDNWRLPELHQMMCHVLFDFGSEEEYWDETNSYIQNKVQPGRVDHIMYNQAHYCLKHREYERARQILDQILVDYPETELYEVVFGTYMGTWYSEGRFQKLFEEAMDLKAAYPVNTHEGLTGRYYLGMAYEKLGEPRKAALEFDEIVAADVDYETDTRGNPIGFRGTAAIQRARLAAEERDWTTIFELSSRMNEALPEDGSRATVRRQIEQYIPAWIGRRANPAEREESDSSRE